MSVDCEFFFTVFTIPLEKRRLKCEINQCKIFLIEVCHIGASRGNTYLLFIKSKTTAKSQECSTCCWQTAEEMTSQDKHRYNYINYHSMYSCKLLLLFYLLLFMLCFACCYLEMFTDFPSPSEKEFY